MSQIHVNCIQGSHVCEINTVSSHTQLSVLFIVIFYTHMLYLSIIYNVLYCTMFHMKSIKNIHYLELRCSFYNDVYFYMR